ncbi:hypothetical protein BJX65DRAFT_321346 [Aspergillus insuetus]
MAHLISMRVTSTSARTRKACDMCHQMKTKCDGAVPCSHCSQSFLDCMYSESRPKRRRNSSQPRRKKNQRQRPMADETTGHDRTGAWRSIYPEPDPPPQPTNVVVGITGDSETCATGPTSKLEIDNGEARFVSSSADRAFVERLRIELGEWPGSDFEKRLRMLDQSMPSFFPPRSARRPAVPLPSLDRARQLVNIALDAHMLYQVLDRDRFEHTFQLLFLLEERDYGEEETSHLPLAYILLALGIIFEKVNDCSIEANAGTPVEAMGYFETCRDLVDLNDCSVLPTLQALFYMNMFLLATSSLNSCYTSLVHVQTLVLRMNLRQHHHMNDGVVIKELTARLFWTIRQLLVLVATCTGLPSPVKADGFHIDLSAQPEDVCPSRQPMLDTSGFLSFIDLHNILDRVLEKMYSPTALGLTQDASSTRHSVRIQTVKEFETQLKNWSDSLPEGCRRVQDIPRLERANYELLMTYCHVQMYLYRPFLHYLSGTPSKCSGSQEHFQKYALSCIEASRNIINMAEDMNRKRLLFGAEWRIAHMILTAALSLLYVPLSSRSSVLASSVLADLETAKVLLSDLRPYCIRAQRGYLVLTVVPLAYPANSSG